MKKKSASQSAFFNLRLLIGLFMALAGVFMALLGFGVFSGVTTAQAQPRYKLVDKDLLSALPPGFDCSRVHELGIDKQENMRAGAIMIACGLSEGGSAPGSGTSGSSIFSSLIKNLLPAPLFIGGGDVDVILPDGTYPKVTQSESMEWGGPNNTWVVNYNDSRTAGACYSGLSYSTDNGVTWHAGQPLCSGHGTNFGDPIVVYNANLGMWFAGDLATGCGGQGVGFWTSPDGITWTVGGCINIPSGAGDRESMWVDNNAASPFYGRMYVSYNNFAVGGGALFCAHSDNGTAWTSVQLTPSFIRDVQVTGDLQGSGRVYVASMNEGGGGFAARQNVMYRSTDGGVTWLNSNTGPAFPAPGRVPCSANSYFVCMFGTDAWRHMGWGEPVANGMVVSLDYAQKGAGSDLGDIYYVRSTDAGVTWGTPVKLNTDAGTAMQWQPSMAGTQSGAIFASWYDQREVNGGADLNCTAGLSSQNCYRRWGRVSFDNGATWQPDDMVGRALTPLPGQPDGTVQPNYQGDYDYHSANGTNIIGGWTDGRNIISSQSQQDVFVNFVTGGGGGGNKIYNIAGFGLGVQTTTTRIYDIPTNTWTTGAPIPEPNGLSDHATAYFNGKIYVAGGYNGSGATNTVRAYDIASNSWSTLAPLPQALYLAGFGIINGKLYVASGNNGSTEVNTLYIYDIASNTWTTGAIVPTPVTGPGSAVYQGKLYLFGGAAPFPNTTTITQIYDPGTNAWSTGPNMNVNRLWFYGGAIDDTSIVAPGGDQSPGIPINDNERLTSSWAIRALLPYNARGPFAVSDGTYVYIGGGYDGSNVHTDTLRYDPVANTYTTLAPAPDGHFLSQAVIVNSGGAPTVTGAVSRKTHGAAGSFDINMPLTGSSGVECRSGGATHDYSLVVTFSGNVTVTGVPQSQVVTGTGCVGSGGTCDPNGTVSVSGSVVTVPLTNIADVQVINVQINGVNGASDEPAVNVNIPMGFLTGDVTGNRVVNASDVALTKSQVGQTVTGSNFREDVNVNGTISATDVALVKSDVGNALPP